MNLGSAVVLPEVFLKAVSIARNLGHSLDGLTTANLDFDQKYRGLLNVLQRPGAEGVALTGHHELMIPLLHAAVIAGLAPGGRAVTMTIVVFCPNLIGDTVMATPAFRALRHAYPGATLLGVIKPHVAPTLDGTRLVRRPDPLRPQVARAASTARGLPGAAPGRAGRPRRALSQLVPLGVAGLVGRDSPEGRLRPGGPGTLAHRSADGSSDEKGSGFPFRSSSITWPSSASWAVASNRSGPSWRRPTPTRRAADRAWASLGLDTTEGRVVCLNTGGAFGPAKSWPNALFLDARAAAGDRAWACRCWSSAARASGGDARTIVEGRVTPTWSVWPIEPLSIGLTQGVRPAVGPA